MILTYHVYYSTILRLGLVAILCVLGAAAALDMIRHHPADSHSIKTLISHYTIILMLNTLARLLWLRRLRQSKNCGKVRASNLIMFHYKDALIVHDIANPKSQSLTTLEEKTGIVGTCISTGNLRPILRYFVRVLTHLASYTPGPVQLIEHIGLTNDVLFWQLIGWYLDLCVSSSDPGRHVVEHAPKEQGYRVWETLQFRRNQKPGAVYYRSPSYRLFPLCGLHRTPC